MIELLEEYSQDGWTVYGLWSVELEGGEVVVVGAVVGVPEYQQGTAKAAGGASPAMCDAWFNDSTDWSDLEPEQKEGALNLLALNAYSLLEEHSQ